MEKLLELVAILSVIAFPLWLVYFLIGLQSRCKKKDEEKRNHGAS